MSEQHQGEPVAWRYKTRVFVQALGYVWREVIETEAPDLNEVAARDLTPLYPHADPSDIRTTRQALESLKGEANDLRAKLATETAHADPGEVERLREDLQKEVLRRQSDESAYSAVVKQNDTLRAQLARVAYWLKRKQQRPSSNDLWGQKIHDKAFKKIGAELARGIDSALPASAEPSEPTEVTNE